MDKMTKCKACGKEIAKGAKTCPECGKDQRNFFSKHKILTGIGVLIIIGVMTSIGGNDDNVKKVDSKVGTEVKQEVKQEEKVTVKEKKEENVPVKEKAEEKVVPTEYKSALKKAKIYSDTMSMSKAGIYNQLTSEYGEKFSKEATQYAIDNVKADWKENALKKAYVYQKEMSMSPSAIYDQLKSDSGEKFTAEESQYAIDNLK